MNRCACSPIYSNYFIVFVFNFSEWDHVIMAVST